MRLALRPAILNAFLALALFGQDNHTLTLEQAEQLALHNHPRIGAAAMNAQAAGTAVRQVKAAYQPLLSGNLTTVGADTGTSIGAGTLQTSGLSSRGAIGVGISQLVTDFGRTASLAESARLRAASQDRNTATARAQVLVQVDQAYFSVLAAEAVLQVARAQVEMQRLTLRQVQALAASNLKSTLDVSFAEVSVSEAELALYQAENTAKANRALLSSAIGEVTDSRFAIADVPLPGPVEGDMESLVGESLRNRPELSAAKLNQSAAEHFADAEKRLRYPSVSVVGVLGAIPVHQGNLSTQYGAAGVNVSIPFLNGGLYAARRDEADYRARQAEKESDAIAIQVAAGVRVAWIEADNAWRRLDLTAKLVDQATTTLRLAKTRYEIGLSGILELTQAQLSLTSAQIAAANAKYDYLNRRAALKYAIGAFH
jgi:outer membrane protein